MCQALESGKYRDEKPGSFPEELTRGWRDPDENTSDFCKHSVINASAEEDAALHPRYWSQTQQAP